MRLTLRTLLAHRDGVLEAKDAALLEAKLRDSTFARQISQRIDESMRNPRLAPIPLDAREPGFDPNHVAEYLDDSITVDQVPDLERRFLENNALLSEVGSCHTILTRALSQPAEVSEEIRRRIHQLPTTPEAQPGKLRIHRLGNVERRIRVDKPIVAPVTPTRTSPETLPANRPISETISQTSLRVPTAEPRGVGIELHEGLGNQVPEYLIGNDRGWWRPVLATSGMLALLIVVGFLAVGPFDQVRQMLSSSDPVEMIEKGLNGKTDSGSSDDEGNVENSARVSSTFDSDGKEELSAIAVPEADRSPKSTETPAVKGVSPPEIRGEGASSTAASLFPEKGVSSSDAEGEVSSASQTPTAPQTSAALPNRVDNSPPIPSNVSTKDWTPSIQWLPETKETSEASLLIAQSATDTATEWRRAKPGESYDGTQLLLLPPTQRTEFSIAPGLRCVASGDTLMRVMPSDQMPRLSVPFGRLILFATPDCRNVTLDLADHVLEIRMNDIQSSCGVDIGWSWNEVDSTGLAEGRFSSSQYIEIIGTQGASKIIMIPKANPTAKTEYSLEIGEFTRWTVKSHNPPTNLESAPNWLRTSVDRPIDQHAASDIARALSKDAERNPKEILIELAQGRKPETAALATRYLFHFHEFATLWSKEGVLSRKGGFVHSATVVQHLPAVLSNDSAKKQYLETMRANLETRADTVMRLLIPMTAKQLEDGGDKLLVEALSSGQQDERTLAILQLSAITGRTLGYHPEKNNSESIAQWRKALGKGEIRLSVSNP